MTTEEILNELRKNLSILDTEVLEVSLSKTHVTLRKYDRSSKCAVEVIVIAQPLENLTIDEKESK